MKPFKGTLHQWVRVEHRNGDIITGVFSGHPVFHGRGGHTSHITSEYYIAGNHFVETLNSLYHLGTKEGARQDESN